MPDQKLHEDESREVARWIEPTRFLGLLWVGGVGGRIRSSNLWSINHNSNHMYLSNPDHCFHSIRKELSFIAHIMKSWHASSRNVRMIHVRRCEAITRISLLDTMHGRILVRQTLVSQCHSKLSSQSLLLRK